jgi:hypothetical protein
MCFIYSDNATNDDMINAPSKQYSYSNTKQGRKSTHDDPILLLVFSSGCTLNKLTQNTPKPNPLVKNAVLSNVLKSIVVNCDKMISDNVTPKRQNPIMFKVLA